jgi:pimeloyl-ACP methyl ester carboxylesterase
MLLRFEGRKLGCYFDIFIFAGMKRIQTSSCGAIALHFSGIQPGADTTPLVLVHGFCEDSSVWQGILPGLSDVPVIAADLPGFGESDLPRTATIGYYAEAVIQALDALGISRFYLMGHSLGGYVALEILAGYGSRLAGMGLVHSHPLADGAERLDARRRGIELLQSGRKDLYVSQLFPGLFAPAYAQAHPETIQALVENGKRQSTEGIIAALEAMMSRKDHRETLRTALCPVLFIAGTEDTLIPAEVTWSSALLPDMAGVEMLPGVGHMGMYEAPEAVIAAVRSLVTF